MKLTFRKAQSEDLLAISSLVNSAYRGPSSEKGWTTEAALLGGQRTDPEILQEMWIQADSAFLLALLDEEIVGSVFLKKKTEGRAYLGMLAVDPERQALGIGRQLMVQAEEQVRQWWQSKVMVMSVIPLRTELISWYERRGYRRTGVIEAFPATNPRFGLPKRDDLSLEHLEKQL